MKHYFLIALLTLAVLCAAGSGCARAARDTSGFALREEAVVNAPFEDTWQTVKKVLNDQGYEIYTRDKRGAFVAYTPMKRTLWIHPRRTKFTIELAQTSPEQTAIGIESVRQVYGVTLLTHPNWHDRAQRDPKACQAILEAIQSTIAAGGIEAEPFVEEMKAKAEAEDSSTPVENETPVAEDAETVSN